MADQSENLNDVHSRLKEFGYYFVESFEEQLQFFRNILEERPRQDKPSSLPMTITTGLANAIPTFGKPISTGLQQGEKFMTKKLDKNRALTMAEIVYFHGDLKEVLREVLLGGVFDLFRSFEMQFLQVNANGGRTRAMQKLATDASHRFLMYLLENYESGEITTELVTKGVLQGESKRHKLGVIKSGRNLMLEGTDESVTTSCLYTKVGIRIGDRFYRTKKTMTNLLGHRLLFDWENGEDVEREWQVDDDDIEAGYKYKLRAEDKNEEVEGMRQYITTKYPLEDLKEFNKLGFEDLKKLDEEASVERQENHSQVMEKQEETIQVVSQVQSVVLDTLKFHHQEILKHTDEKFHEVNENVNEKHSEVSQNFHVIRSELAETEGKLATRNEELAQDVSVLKGLKEELDKNVVLKINRNEVKKVEEVFKNIKEIVLEKTDEFKERLDEIEKEDVREVLREMDPTRTEGFKKLKKRFRF